MKIEDLTVGQIVYAPHRRLYGAKVWREVEILEIDLVRRQVRAKMAVVHAVVHKIGEVVRSATGQSREHAYLFPERQINYWRAEPETHWVASL